MEFGSSVRENSIVMQRLIRNLIINSNCLCRLENIGKIRKLIGTRSSDDFRSIDVSKDRFTDLQEAVHYIQTVVDMTESDSTRAKVWPTLGHLLATQLKSYATETN